MFVLRESKTAFWRELIRKRKTTFLCSTTNAMLSSMPLAGGAGFRKMANKIVFCRIAPQKRNYSFQSGWQDYIIISQVPPNFVDPETAIRCFRITGSKCCAISLQAQSGLWSKLAETDQSGLCLSTQPRHTCSSTLTICTLFIYTT